jgi:hypothetical protein
MFDKKQINDSSVRERLSLNHNQTLVKVGQPVRERLSLNHNQTLVRSS